MEQRGQTVLGLLDRKRRVCREPRSFTARYGALLDGLSAQERRARLAKVAKAITHPAIPEEERHHLYVNIHHGHLQGANKCKGDQRYCATCLQTRNRCPVSGGFYGPGALARRRRWVRPTGRWEKCIFHAARKKNGQKRPR